MGLHFATGCSFLVVFDPFSPIIVLFRVSERHFGLAIPFYRPRHPVPIRLELGMEHTTGSRTHLEQGSPCILAQAAMKLHESPGKELPETSVLSIGWLDGEKRFVCRIFKLAQFSCFSFSLHHLISS
jgi:hypothetical protein